MPRYFSWFLFALLTLSRAELFCDDLTLEKEVREADIALQIRQYEAAIDRYKEALGSDPAEWEAFLIQSNMANTYLWMGKWDLAAGKFRELLNNYELPEGLKEDTSLRFAYALYQNAIESARQQETTSEEVVVVLQEALSVLPKEAPCCKKLYEAIEASLGNFLLLKENIVAARVSVRDKVALLVRRLQWWIDNLGFANEQKEKTSALLPFNQVEKSFWSHTATLLPKQQKIFFEAQTRYEQALQNLQSNHLEQAKVDFAAAKKKLEQLLESIPANTVADMLNFLVDKYNYVSGMTLLPAYERKILQARTNSLLQENLPESTQKQMKAASGILELAFKADAAGQHKEAKYYLIASYQRVQRALYEFKTANKHTPQYVLESAIQEQQHALELAEMLDSLPSSQQTEEMIALNQHVQAAAETIALGFTKIALIQQKLLFYSDDAAKQCQDEPWKEVFPLVYEGLSAAALAEKYIKRTPPSFGLANTAQKKAMEKWQSALQQLNRPPQQQKQTSSQSSPTSQANEQEIEQMLQGIVEMDQDDKELKSSVNSPETVERPW